MKNQYYKCYSDGTNAMCLQIYNLYFQGQVNVFQGHLMKYCYYRCYDDARNVIRKEITMLFVFNVKSLISSRVLFVDNGLIWGYLPQL